MVNFLNNCTLLVTVRLIHPSDKEFDNIIDSVNSKLNN